MKSKQVGSKKKPNLRLVRFIDYHDGKREIILGIFRHKDDRQKYDLFDLHMAVKKFNDRHGTSLEMISPGLANNLLIKRNGWDHPNFWDAVSPFPTNIAIGYETFGKKLESEIVYSCTRGSRVVLPTGRFMGEKHIALAVLNMRVHDIRRCGESLIIDVPESRLMAIRGFGIRHGLLAIDPETTIPYEKSPVGIPIDNFQYRKLSHHLPYGNYVGPLVRSMNRMETIVLNCPPAESLGILVEVPSGDIGKLDVRSVFEISGITPDELKCVMDRAWDRIDILGKMIKDGQMHALTELKRILCGCVIK